MSTRMSHRQKIMKAEASKSAGSAAPAAPAARDEEKFDSPLPLWCYNFLGPIVLAIGALLASAAGLGGQEYAVAIGQAEQSAMAVPLPAQDDLSAILAKAGSEIEARRKAAKVDYGD